MVAAAEMLLDWDRVDDAETMVTVSVTIGAGTEVSEGAAEVVGSGNVVLIVYGCVEDLDWCGDSNSLRRTLVVTKVIGLVNPGLPRLVTVVLSSSTSLSSSSWARRRRRPREETRSAGDCP